MKTFIMTLTSVATLNFLATMLPQNNLATLNLAIGCVASGLAIGLAVSYVATTLIDIVVDRK